MKLTFLGTAAGAPTLRRNVSALALQFDQRRDWWLFDCGEGTQHQIQKTDLSPATLRRIFISHLHGDHCFGLLGLLASRGMHGATEPIDLYGPPGLADYVNSIRRTTGTRLAYPFEIHELAEDGEFFEDDEYRVSVARVLHAGITLAYCVTEKDRAGRFKLEEAQALGIPPGPIYARLKRGEMITLDDGRSIDGATLVDPPRAGRKLAVVCDTKDASAMLPFAQGADVAIHEATYANADVEHARQNAHSTSGDAGRFAAQAGAKQLIMTHFSPRYDQRGEGVITISDLVTEAEAAFVPGRVLAAKDFMRYEIKSVKREPTQP
ncbi:MAG: ribonuclease Z [Planctomycetota bacterium]